jgi:hypothetical protein
MSTSLGCTSVSSQYMSRPRRAPAESTSNMRMPWKAVSMSTATKWNSPTFTRTRQE